MADRQIGNNLGLPIRTGNAQNGGASTTAGFTDPDNDTLSAMRARLTAINAGVYTTAKLNEMSWNDMVYAIRVADNPTTLN